MRSAFHHVRAAASLVGGRLWPDHLRRVWRRLWFDEHPLLEMIPLGADDSASPPLRPIRVRLAGRIREAGVVHAPFVRRWRVRTPRRGELRLWVAVMPGEWARGASARVTISISHNGGETRTFACELQPKAVWAHRRWQKLTVPLPSSGIVELRVAGADGTEVALADGVVRWRRPAAESRVLARAFAARVRRGGLRDTARWAQRSTRRDDDGQRYQRWCARHTPGPEALAAMASTAGSWRDAPRFSILTPVYNTDPAWLRACIASVRAQAYPHWQWILSDDASTREDTRAVLREIADPRIQVVWNEVNRGIAGATQAALDRATGDFLALLDHDDELLPHALFRVAARLREQPELDLIYSDEDKLELDGRRSDVYFKPGWSPDLFLSSMYICHFLVLRRSLVLAAGGFRPGYDGSQDYDLVLRVLDHSPRIAHVADVLYHWRKIPQSASSTGAAKPWAHLAGARALQDYADRNGLAASVEDAGPPGLYRVRYQIQGAPRVSVITTVEPGQTDPGWHMGHPRASYTERELIVVSDGSSRGASADRVKHVTATGPLAARLNAAAAEATGDYLIFLGAMVEPLHDDWIEALLEHAQRPGIGAVGGKLFYPDGRLRHAGLTIGPDDLGRRSFDGYPGTWAGYFSNANAVHNRAAVSGAAMMVPKAVFATIGGWQTAAADPDVALGDAIRARGLRLVFTPYARFTDAAPERPGPPVPTLRPEVAAHIGQRDPYYNRHFAVESPDYIIRAE